MILAVAFRCQISLLVGQKLNSNGNTLIRRIAGVVGVVQTENGALKPQLGWIIAEE